MFKHTHPLVTNFCHLVVLAVQFPKVYAWACPKICAQKSQACKIKHLCLFFPCKNGTTAQSCKNRTNAQNNAMLPLHCTLHTDTDITSLHWLEKMQKQFQSALSINSVGIYGMPRKSNYFFSFFALFARWVSRILASEMKFVQIFFFNALLFKPLFKFDVVFCLANALLEHIQLEYLAFRLLPSVLLLHISLISNSHACDMQKSGSPLWLCIFTFNFSCHDSWLSCSIQHSLGVPSMLLCGHSMAPWIGWRKCHETQPNADAPCFIMLCWQAKLIHLWEKHQLSNHPGLPVWQPFSFSPQVAAFASACPCPCTTSSIPKVLAIISSEFNQVFMHLFPSCSSKLSTTMHCHSSIVTALLCTSSGIMVDFLHVVDGISPASEHNKSNYDWNQNWSSLILGMPNIWFVTLSINRLLSHIGVSLPCSLSTKCTLHWTWWDFCSLSQSCIHWSAWWDFLFTYAQSLHTNSEGIFLIFKDKNLLQIWVTSKSNEDNPLSSNFALNSIQWKFLLTELKCFTKLNSMRCVENRTRILHLSICALTCLTLVIFVSSDGSFQSCVNATQLLNRSHLHVFPVVQSFCSALQSCVVILFCTVWLCSHSILHKPFCAVVQSCFGC